MKFKVYNCLVIIFSVFIISCSKDSSNDNLGLPSVVTLEIDNLTYNSVESGGSIISNGGTSIISCGVVWSTNENPTINDFKTTDVLSVSEFTSSITNLEPDTTYYLKAYATNSKGTSYGNQISFTTNQLILPEVLTEDVSHISGFLSLTGNITTDNGLPITERGFVWSDGTVSSNSNLSIQNGNVIPVSGTGIGYYATNENYLQITNQIGLYISVRAYATNSQGTSYGDLIGIYVPAPIHVGDLTEGGIVFYTDGDYQGMVVSIPDSNTLLQWGCLGVDIPTLENFNTGYSNSIDIHNAHIYSNCYGNFAVEHCLNFQTQDYGGASDWFLPSKNELDILYQYYSQGNLSQLNGTTIWSSTQYDSQKAWSQTFNSNGTQLSENKDTFNSVVSIRTYGY